MIGTSVLGTRTIPGVVKTGLSPVEVELVVRVKLLSMLRMVIPLLLTAVGLGAGEADSNCDSPVRIVGAVGTSDEEEEGVDPLLYSRLECLDDPIAAVPSSSAERGIMCCSGPMMLGRAA